MRLDPPVVARADRGVDVEAVVSDEGLEVSNAVRDQRELQVEPAQLLEDGQRVLVEVEVAVLLPGALDRGGAFARPLALAAHTADDPLGEGDPNLLVVLQLRVPLERRDGRGSRVLVAGRVELEAELLAAPPVALRPELGPRASEREVDVQEDCADRHHPASTSHRATCAWSSCPIPHATV